MLVLLLMTATGAWAQDAKHLITATYFDQTRSLEQPLPYATTIGEFYEAVTGEPFSNLISSMSALEMTLSGISSRNTSVVGIGELNGASTPVTVKADGETAINLIFGNYVQGIIVSVVPPLYAYMKDDVKDADKWTVKVGEGQAQALPIGGLKGDGSETVTLTYKGRLKVKGVKATSDAGAAAGKALSEATAEDLGKVIGADGYIYDNVEAATAAGTAASAIIAYVGTAGSVDESSSTYKGLAIALTDANSGVTYQWCSEIGNTCVSQTDAIATAITYKNGIASTNTLTSDGHTHAAATAASSYGTARPSGVSAWFLPSVGQWNLIVQGLATKQAGSTVSTNLTTSANNTYKSSNLNSVITDAGGTGFQSGGYWSSTEHTSGSAWRMIFSLGRAYSNSKTANNYVRAVFCFGGEAEQAKPAATVTTAPTGAAMVGVGKTTELVSGGVADGGKLMYRVTTENTKPASTDGFSADEPTAKDITASGKVYVWYYVKGDDTHSDSEIAATAIEVPVADIVWDATNVKDIMVFSAEIPYEMEGVKLSGNGEQIRARWRNYGDPTMDGISFEMFTSGGFTFTAPTGKAFTKIEMTLNESAGWDIAGEEAKLGTGWAFNAFYIDDVNMIYTVMWKGSPAASTVDLLTGADMFTGSTVKYIAFYLSE